MGTNKKTTIMPNSGLIVVFGLSKINCLLGARFGPLKTTHQEIFQKEFILRKGFFLCLLVYYLLMVRAPRLNHKSTVNLFR